MSMQVGEVNLLQSAVELEYRVITLEKILEKILSSNSTAIKQEEINACQREAMHILQKKYPNMGIGPINASQK